MRLFTGLALYCLSVIGAIRICDFFSFPMPYIIGFIVTSLLFSLYIALWFKELGTMEQEYQRNIMHEERIPVIGTKPIDWDEYRDIPKFDINAPLTFDRNKIGYLYEPNKPLT